jgi:hypothetical protein
MDRRHGWSAYPICRAFLFIALFTTGCADEITLRQVVIESAELQATRSTEHAPLRAELARLEEERGLPSHFNSAPPGDENVATALTKVVDPMLRRGILERSDALFPEERFQLTPLELAETRQFLGKHRDRLNRFYKALDRPCCAFEIDYRLGFFQEPSFIDDATICCRLLAFEIADLLAGNDVAASLRPFTAMWRLVGWLGQEQHLTARLAAADLRAEALLALEAIANHPHCRRGDLEVLYQLLADQLAHWPSDERALAGDRAMTLHAYECIRGGLLSWVLTSEEKDRFREQLNLDSLSRVALETIDQDEAFYLHAMRRHIELCRQPYFRRKPELARLAEQIDRTRTSATKSEYPLLAAVLFLPGIDQAHETVARDRACCEAAALALALALGRDLPPYEINPHLGQPYEVVRETHRVVVRLGAADERDVCVVLPAE